MGIKKWKNRHGEERLYLSLTWPDGKRYRRVMANIGTAEKTESVIKAAIALGTWRELRETLTAHPDQAPPDPTIREFADVYLEEYCRAKNRRPDFKETQLGFIKAIIGKVLVSEVTKAHGYQFIAGRRKKKVADATVNRGLAVLKNMMTFAAETGLVETNPLLGFSLLPEPQHALRVMTLEEERRLVTEVYRADQTIGAFVAVLGETGLRLQEGLDLQWSAVDLGRQELTVGRSKSGRVRHVPLSPYAVEWFRSLRRIVGIPWCFLIGDTRPWRDPRGPLFAGRKAAGLTWVGFHDLRHFRASQWAMRGIDLRTIQELLGHQSITVTQRYAHFAPSHARAEVLRVGRLELEGIDQVEQASNE